MRLDQSHYEIAANLKANAVFHEFYEKFAFAFAI